MTVILSRSNLARTKSVLSSNAFEKLAHTVASFLTPKTKQTESAPAPTATPAEAPVATSPAPQPDSAPTAKNTSSGPLTLTAPVLPPAMFADQNPGSRDKDGDTVPMWGFLEECTEAEGMMLHTMREYNKAQTDPHLRARLTAWDNVRHNVDWFLQGTFTMESAVDGWGKEEAPARYAAIQTIASLFPLFVQYLRTGKEEPYAPPETTIIVPTAHPAVPSTDEDDTIDPIARNEKERSILDLFRHISPDEQNYLISAGFDAESRTHAMEAGDGTPTEEHRMVAEFGSWVDAVREDPQRRAELRGGGFTPEQNKSLKRAWTIIQGVFAECEEADEDHA